MTRSSWLQWNQQQQQQFLSNLTIHEKAKLLYDWQFWAREKQMPPEWLWSVWLILSGRGFGKTRTGAEWIRSRAESGRFSRFALIGQTAADVRDVMVEGDSGLLKCSPSWFYPRYEPSKRRLTWPNGATATTFSGDEPDQLRGPQFDSAWADEPAKWKYAEAAWDNMEMGLRLGVQPQVVATTTPRPIPLIKKLVADPQTAVTLGHTNENADNLSARFVERVIRKYEGTRLGRQELAGEILDDNPGALWKRVWIERNRFRGDLPVFARVVVGVDPAASGEEGGGETGIVVVGVEGKPLQRGYVLEDGSLAGSPSEWAGAAVSLYHKYRADRIIAERNQGGEMVEHTIHTADKRVPVTLVHASRGKAARAEPVSSLYERDMVFHVGAFPHLEDQLCEWDPFESPKSPDRLDALVWAVTELMLDSGVETTWSVY